MLSVVVKVILAKRRASDKTIQLLDWNFKPKRIKRLTGSLIGDKLSIGFKQLFLIINWPNKR